MNQVDDLLRSLRLMLEAELWPVQDVVEWADGVISHVASPATWLLDVSLCTTVDEAGRVVNAEIDRSFWRQSRPELSREHRDAAADADTRVLVGLYLLRYHRGLLPLTSLNGAILGILDAYDASFLKIDDPRLVEADGDILSVPELDELVSALASEARAMELRLTIEHLDLSVFDESTVPS